MLKERVITGVSIVGGLLAALIFLEPVALSCVFAVLVLIGAWEWANLSGFTVSWQKAVYVILVAAGIGFCINFTQLFAEGQVQTAVVQEILRVACTWWAIALLLVKFYPGSAVLWGGRLMRAGIGIIVLVPAWLAVSFLRTTSDGIFSILLAIALVVAADVGAYFAGRAFGKAKLAPNVSPGKSWAGFWGGMALSLLLVVPIWLYWPGGLPIALPAMLVLAGVTVLASVLGDLSESMVKRHRGIKDSGNILPGHGGVMDRLDSLSAALPVFTLGFILSGWV